MTQIGIEVSCWSPKLTWLEPGHPASDYYCPNFRLHLISARQGGFWYQLKSQKELTAKPPSAPSSEERNPKPWRPPRLGGYFTCGILPDKGHIQDKIRQQLQVLRDAGLLSHVERGVWRFH